MGTGAFLRRFMLGRPLGVAPLDSDGALPLANLKAHASTHNAGGTDAMAIDAAAATGSLRTLGTAATAACAGNDARLVPLVDAGSRILETYGVGYGGGMTLTADTAYWAYLGRATSAFTLAYINLTLTTNGAGTQTMELGIFSGNIQPTRGSNVTMTKIAATGSVDTCLAGAVKVVKNSSSLAASITAGMYLYAGIRTNFSVTQPSFSGIIRELGLGRVLSTASAGALTGTGPWTAVPVAFVADATMMAPRMAATLD